MSTRRLHADRRIDFIKKRAEPIGTIRHAAGAILTLGVRLLASSGMPAPSLIASSALLIAAYTFGVLIAYRRREKEDVRLLLEVQEELRFSQDHIMANETYRSLSAYLEIAAHQMKEPLQGLMGGLKIPGLG